MKNLPDKFPIRYALIIETEDFIFNQYLMLLNKKPLDYSLLFPRYHSASFSILNRKAFEITEIKNNSNWENSRDDDDEWALSIEDRLKEIIPNISLGGISIGIGSINMYSYKKSAEIPAFVHFRNKGDDDAKYFNKIFDGIKNGKYNNFDLYQELFIYLKAIKQDLYYSSIWKELDNNKDLKGIITNSMRIKDKDFFRELSKNEENKEKITVLICRSWKELFAEEVFALYKMFNYCNNCGKALPFNYNGRYCPEGPESIDCIRERARKRKHSQNKD